MGKRFAVALAAILMALFTWTGAGFTEDAKPVEKPRTFNVGDKLIPLELTNLDGKSESLKLGSGITAITIFTTACSACMNELDLLNRLKEEKKDALKVVGLCVDAAGAENVERFLGKTKYTNFVYYIDPTFEKAQSLGFSFSPGLILADSKGEIFFRKNGFMSRDAKEITSKILK